MAAWTGTPSPWAAWNLRCNPFGEPAPHEVPGLIVADIDGLEIWASKPRHAVQLLGDQGRGKTARLRALEPRLGLPYLYLDEQSPLPELPRSGGLLLDEAQRLPRRRRRRLFGELRHLVLSSHEDLERELVAAGWRVRTVEVSGDTGARLDEILERRIRWARLGPGPLPRVSEATRRALARRHGDDLRSLLDQLYELFQRAVDRSAPPEGRHGEV